MIKVSVEQLAIDLSSKLGNKLNKSKEEIEVLKYGLFILLHTTMAILITAILGIITGTFLEIMIISITAALLKRYSGGIHASTPERCIILGLIMSSILSLICKFLVDTLDFNNLVIFSIISLSIVSYILYKKCPVGNKNKPLKKESIRRRLRKKTFKFMIFVCIIVLVLLFAHINKKLHFTNTIIVSIELGLILQVFGLTIVGNKFVEIFENILDCIKVK